MSGGERKCLSVYHGDALLTYVRACSAAAVFVVCRRVVAAAPAAACCSKIIEPASSLSLPITIFVVPESKRGWTDRERQNTRYRGSRRRRRQQRVDASFFFHEAKLLFDIAIPTVAVQFSAYFIYPQTASAVGRRLGTEELAGYSLASLTGNLTCLSVIVELSRHLIRSCRRSECHLDLSTSVLSRFEYTLDS